MIKFKNFNKSISLSSPPPFFAWCFFSLFRAEREGCQNESANCFKEEEENQEFGPVDGIEV